MTQPTGKGRQDFTGADEALEGEMDQLLREGLSLRRASLVLVDAGKVSGGGGRESLARRLARRFWWLSRGIPGAARGTPRHTAPESVSDDRMTPHTPAPAPVSAADLAALEARMAARVEALEARVDAITGEARDAA